MFEPLSDVIRLRRLQRNLTQERLAKLAGVSRRQLSLMEDGANVSLLFLTKIARVLELTEIPVGELRLRGSQPELTTIVRTAEALEHLKQNLPQWEATAAEIRAAAATLDELLEAALAEGATSSQEILESAERLARIAVAERIAAERAATAATLRTLGEQKPAARAGRPKSAASPARKQRSR
jgi:transcriptional regulator with XRE-family HTH domain